MKRKEAIKVIFNSISKTDITVSTTGLISREVFTTFHSDRNIYVPGSMGLVSSIGLGVALSNERRVVVIDGDASLLMNLGTMVTIGKNKPLNLLHIVLDNGAYGSCSEEVSMSSFANFEKIAKDVGYSFVRAIEEKDEFKDCITSFKNGPGFILVKIKLGGERNLKRPLDLVEIKEKFMNFIK